MRHGLTDQREKEVEQLEKKLSPTSHCTQKSIAGIDINWKGKIVQKKALRIISKGLQLQLTQEMNI